MENVGLIGFGEILLESLDRISLRSTAERKRLIM